MDDESHEESGNQQQDSELTSDENINTGTCRLRVTDIGWLNDEKTDDETPATTFSRLHEELVSLRARCDGYEAEIESLSSTPPTTVITVHPGRNGGEAVRPLQVTVCGETVKLSHGEISNAR